VMGRRNAARISHMTKAPLCRGGER
jgi:hypothetical protein